MLSARVALVVGARTKLGHQVVVKLLQAGATVFGTTRFPDEALTLFRQYPDWETWQERLHFYPSPFDLDTPDLQAREIMGGNFSGVHQLTQFLVSEFRVLT